MEEYLVDEEVKTLMVWYLLVKSAILYECGLWHIQTITTVTSSITAAAKYFSRVRLCETP